MLGFSKDIARIYVEDVREHVNRGIVPVFPPDTSLEVGDVVSLDEDGRLARRGSVIGKPKVQLDIEEHQTAPEVFASSSKVSIGPSIAVNGPLGGQLVKATLSFTKGRSVVASFRPGTLRRVRDADAFSTTLMSLWLDNQLNRARFVVWEVRKSGGGTVIVSTEGGNQIETFADPSQLGPVGLTFADLALGVTFGSEQKVSWKMSDPNLPLVTSVRLFCLDKKQRSVIDGYPFEPSERQRQLDSTLQRPAEMTADELLALL